MTDYKAEINEAIVQQSSPYINETKPSELSNYVKSFMVLAGQGVSSTPSIPDINIRKLRAKLILEEAFEQIQYGLGLDVEVVSNGMLPMDPTKKGEFSFVDTGKLPDIAELLDSHEDLKVISTGTLLSFGIYDSVDATVEIGCNNLLKFRTDLPEDEGGYRDEDGKWIKPKNHPKPRTDEILTKMAEFQESNNGNW